MDNLLIYNAVPFGYTGELNDFDFFYGDECLSAENMDWQNVPRGLIPALPDVILSNTPPPSPLRRAHSYHSFFPEKSRTQTTTPLPPPSLETPPATPTARLEDGRNGPARTSSVDRLMNGEESVKTGLEHIQEVRRRVQNDPHHQQDLPQLSWALPSPHHHPQRQVERGSSEDERESNQRETGNVQRGEAEEEQERWRRVGGDLRKIADQFQQKHDKVETKSKDEESLNLAVPVSLTRCLTASIFFLVWWRLFNKFH